MERVMRLDMTIRTAVHRRDSETNRTIADASYVVGIRKPWSGHGDEILPERQYIKNHIP
jgi:hypothetical protein